MRSGIPCAPCQRRRVQADADYRVDGEPWCKHCADKDVLACARCGEAVSKAQAQDGGRGRMLCQTCERVERLSGQAQLYGRYF
jgi:formylmethanofuran dehydrogenase subunit E